MTQTDDRLIFLIAQARQRLFTRLDNALLERVGVTTAQSGALFFLAQHDGRPLLALARGLMLDKSAATRMAERLEKKGLIERRPCPQDRRAVRVFLTPSGRWAERRCLTIVKEHNNAIKDGFAPDEIRKFSHILQTIIQRFREE
jgi:DNA-binding MarR family transcriptional regulator